MKAAGELLVEPVGEGGEDAEEARGFVLLHQLLEDLPPVSAPRGHVVHDPLPLRHGADHGRPVDDGETPSREKLPGVEIHER